MFWKVLLHRFRANSFPRNDGLENDDSGSSGACLIKPLMTLLHHSLISHQALLLFPINLLCRPPSPVMIICKHIWCYFSDRLFGWKLGRTSVSELRTGSEWKSFRCFSFRICVCRECRRFPLGYVCFLLNIQPNFIMFLSISRTVTLSCT